MKESARSTRKVRPEENFGDNGECQSLADYCQKHQLKIEKQMYCKY